MFDTELTINIITICIATTRQCPVKLTAVYEYTVVQCSRKLLQ